MVISVSKFRLPLLTKLSILISCYTLELKAQPGSGIETQTAEYEQVIFKDDFNTPESFYEDLTLNAIHKEYTGHSLKEGHLLKKWKYSWEYSYEDTWLQAFYVVAPGESVMTQAGRFACRDDIKYRIVANAPIPKSANKYTITFRQLKRDNDPLVYMIGANNDLWSEVQFGFQNQLPLTDETVDDMYLRGVFGDGVIKRNMAHGGEWAYILINVDVESKVVTWKINDKLVAAGYVADLASGGYFGMYMCYDRSSQFDDFKITVSEE